MTLRARLALSAVAPLVLVVASGCEEVVAEPPFDGAVDADVDAEEAGPVDAFAPPDVQAPDLGLLE